MTELLSYSFIYNSLHNDNNDLNCNFDPRLIYKLVLTMKRNPSLIVLGDGHDYIIIWFEVKNLNQ